MLDSLLDQLARQCGIGDGYENYRGDSTSISAATRKAILAAMGWPTDDVAAIERVLHEREAARWRSLLPPVAVTHPGKTSIEVSVADEHLDRSLESHVFREGGSELAGRVRCGDLAEIERGHLDGRPYTRRSLALPADIAHGYHSLRASLEGGAGAQCALISAPRGCFEPQALRDGRRCWGVAVQLYTLRSPRNWGIGDFADLDAAVRGFAPAGASFIALNPLHALFPANPGHFSPYSPSSRHFLNVLYIVVERLPEFVECAEAQRRVGAPEFQAELARLRSVANVDYPGVAAAKLPLLRLLFEHFAREHLSRGSDHAQPVPRLRRGARRVVATARTARRDRRAPARSGFRSLLGLAGVARGARAIPRSVARSNSRPRTRTRSRSTPGCSGRPRNSWARCSGSRASSA